MKTLTPKIALLAIVGMLYLTEGNTQNKAAVPNGMIIYSGTANNAKMADEIRKENDNVKKDHKELTLSISVVENKATLNDATVKIYNENKLIAVLNSDIQRKLKVELKNDTYYIMEVSSPGYTTKSVMISTAFPADTMNTDDGTIYEHKASISLSKRPKTNINIPYSVPTTGIVYYDPEQDIFIGCPMLKDSPNKQEIIAQIEDFLGS